MLDTHGASLHLGCIYQTFDEEAKRVDIFMLEAALKI